MKQLLNVGEVCSRTVAFVTEDMSLKQAANLMRAQHVGTLVVVRETPAGKVVCGMLTDRDIAIVAVAREFDPQTLRAGEIMTENVVTAEPGDSIYDALASMRKAGVRRLPVVSKEGVLEGIVSMDDILEVVTEELQMLVQAMSTERSREQRIRV